MCWWFETQFVPLFVIVIICHMMFTISSTILVELAFEFVFMSPRDLNAQTHKRLWIGGIVWKMTNTGSWCLNTNLNELNRIFIAIAIRCIVIRG